MYLSIILTIFVVLQITTLVLVYKWWNKYGRKMFDGFKQIKGSFPTSKGGKPVNPFENMPDIGKMMGELNEMTKKMNNLK
jgi:hypothetical protein